MREAGRGMRDRIGRNEMLLEPWLDGGLDFMDPLDLRLNGTAGRHRAQRHPRARARRIARINRLDGWFKVLGLPFVTRTVQPVIEEIEREVEEAKAQAAAAALEACAEPSAAVAAGRSPMSTVR
mgnify:CR=1 FL=1